MLCNIAQIGASRRGALSDGLEPWEAALNPAEPMHVHPAIGQMRVTRSNNGGLAVELEGEGYDRLPNS